MGPLSVGKFVPVIPPCSLHGLTEKILRMIFGNFTTLTHKLDCPLKLARPGGFLIELSVMFPKLAKPIYGKNVKGQRLWPYRGVVLLGLHVGESRALSERRAFLALGGGRWPFIAIPFTDNHPPLGFSKLLLTHPDHKYWLLIQRGLK